MSEEKKIEETIEEKAKKMAEIVKSELGLESLKKEILDAIDEKELARSKENVMKIFVGEDTQKAVSEMTGEEKSKAFAHALFTGNTTVLKTLSETNADGGFTVPQDFYNTLVMEVADVAIMRAKVTVIPMKGPVLTIPVGEHGPDVYWTGEGVTKTTTTMDFRQPTITAYKMAAIIYLTDELIEDSAFDLTGILVKRFADAIATMEDKVIINGAGTTQPTGIFVNTTVATITCTAAGISFDDIIRLEYTLPVKYRANAAFLINPQLVGELRLLKDTTNRYLWQDPVSAGQPAMIHGYPVVENYWVPVTQIAFGDYKQAYWLGDRQKMTVKITNDTETTFTQDKTAIRVVERIGGDVVISNAIRKLISIP